MCVILPILGKVLSSHSSSTSMRVGIEFGLWSSGCAAVTLSLRFPHQQPTSHALIFFLSVCAAATCSVTFLFQSSSTLVLAWSQWEKRTEHGSSPPHAPRFRPAGFRGSRGAHDGSPAHKPQRSNHIFGTMLETDWFGRSMPGPGWWWNPRRRRGQPTATTWWRRTTNPWRRCSQRRSRSGRTPSRPSTTSGPAGHHVWPRRTYRHHPHCKASQLHHQTHWSMQTCAALVFLQEGLCEAVHVVRQPDENDTLTITKVEAGQVTVWSAGSLAASKNAKLDHQLTYSEFMYAKNLFLMAIDNAKWGDDTIDSFNWFFHNLDNHPMREEGDRGERELLLYTSRAHMDWHDKLMLHKAYNIATINEDLLAKIARELDSREVQANLKQVRILIHVSPTRLISFTASSCLTTPPNHVLSMLLLLMSNCRPCCCHCCYHHRGTAAAFPPPFCFACNGVVWLIQMDLTHANRFQPTDHGQQFTWDMRIRRPSWSASPRPAGSARAHAQHTTGRSPGENHHGAAAATIASGAALFATLNPCRPAQSALEPTKSAPTALPAMCRPCGIIQRLLNKSGQILCWDFQRPRGCLGKGHNHECLGCGDANHGAQECPLRQRTTSTPVK